MGLFALGENDFFFTLFTAPFAVIAAPELSKERISIVCFLGVD